MRVLDSSTVKKLVNAMSIRERLDTFKKNNISLDIENKYIEAWKSRKSVIKSDSFNTKLKVEGFSEKEFNYAIKDLSEEDREMLSTDLVKSDWFNKFEEILEHFIEKEENIIDDNETKPDYGLDYTVRPFLFWAYSRIKKAINELKNFHCNDEIPSQVIESLNGILLQITNKSLVIELHIAKANNELEGLTPEERFKCFVKNEFKNLDSIVNFYTKYAVLARLLTVKTDYFIKHVIEALNRLDNNFNTIQQVLEINIDGHKLNKIISNEGDSHQKGKSVIQFVFSNEIRVIYKPRNLKVCEKYYDFVRWINKNSNLLDFYINKGFYANEFSFEKFVEYNSCENKEEIKRFYTRFGQTIALMYILKGTDFHYENIIANAEYPVIIDLETVLHQVMPLKFNDSADVVAKYEIMDSVISTCLIPFIALKKNSESGGIDFSALNGDKQTLPYKVLAPNNIMTDDMRYEYTEITMEGGSNIPKLNDNKVDFRMYQEFILKGFRDTCEFIISDKESLVSKESILNIFKGCLTRQVIKNTSTYGEMLNYSYHPNCTQDFKEREKLFENSWGYPYMDKRNIEAEILDMLYEDIPMFSAYADSRDIITSTGERIKDYFETTSLDRVLDNIKKLNQKEIDKQLSYILVNFGEYKNQYKKNFEENEKKFLGDLKTNAFNDVDLLKEAIDLGEELLSMAKESNNNDFITWLEVNYQEDGLSEIRPTNENLYNGLSGKAVYYYQLYKETNNEKYRNLMQVLIKSALERSKYSKVVSAFIGKASLLYPLLLVYKDEKREDYRKIIEDICDYIEENIDNITEYDWLGGTTGLIKMTLNTYDVLGEEKYLILSKKLGEKLIDQLSNVDRNKLLGGMSHGASGIAVVLLQLSQYLNENKFKVLALEMIEHDRSLFDSKRLGWIDKRDGGNEIATKWCHGSTGIGMSRLLMSKYYNDSKMDEEIEIAVSSNKDTIHNDDCLCHGNFGDIELLLQVYNKSKDENIKSIIYKKLSNIFSFKKELNKFRLREIPQFKDLGLFTGMTGIGYELLRLRSPERIPNVMMLEL